MINSYLDYTDLNLAKPSKEVMESVKDAIFLNCYGFCTYISNHFLVDKVVTRANSQIKKIYVVGFPQGTMREYRRDLSHIEYCNADEIDVVLPAYFHFDKLIRASKMLSAVRKLTKGKVLKVIIETTLLDEKGIFSAVRLVEDVGGDYIKTNTGFIHTRRTRTLVEDVKLIKEYTKLPIKASGGIRDYSLAKELVDAGVSRIGTSSARQIIDGEKAS